MQIILHVLQELFNNITSSPTSKNSYPVTTDILLHYHAQFSNVYNRICGGISRRDSVPQLFLCLYVFMVSYVYFQYTTWNAQALISADPGCIMSAWWITILLHWLTGYHHGSLSGYTLIMGTVMDHYLVMLQKHQWQVKATNTWN